MSTRWLLPAAVYICVGLLIADRAPYLFALALLFALLSTTALKASMALRPEQVATRVAAGWIAMALLPHHRLSNRNPLAALEGSVSPENLLEVSIYGGFAVLMHLHVRSVRRTSGASPIFRVGWALAAFAAVSSLWSGNALFTLTRALEYAVPALVGLYTAILARELGDWRRFYVTVFRRYLQFVSILIGFGLVFPSWVSGRFTWLGASPVNAGIIVGAGLVLALSALGSDLYRSAVARGAAILFLSGALLATQARTAIAALAVGAAAQFWVANRPRRGRRLAISLGTSAALVAGWILYQGELVTYIERGQSARSLSELSGRVPLWESALRSITTPWEWMAGSGFSNARGILYPEFSFAGNAHNAWVEMLLNLGILGTGMLALLVVGAGARALQAGLSTSVKWGAASFGVVLYILVVSPTSESIALPGATWTLLWLVIGLLECTRMETLSPQSGRITVSGESRLSNGRPLGP